MKLHKNLIIVTILSGIYGCQMLYPIVAINNTDAKIGINVLHFEDNTFYKQRNHKKFTILPKDSLIIKSSALRFVSIVHDYELIPIVIENESGEILSIIRVCGHFLRITGSKLDYPYDVENRGVIKQSDLNIDNYFLAQDYFNRAQYEQCLSTITLIDLNNTLSINPSILKNTGKGTDTRIEATVKRGFAILAFISSKKLSRDDIALKYSEYLNTNHFEYWNTVKKRDPEFLTNFKPAHNSASPKITPLRCVNFGRVAQPVECHITGAVSLYKAKNSIEYPVQ